MISDYPYSTPIFIKHPQRVVACKPLAMPGMHVFSCRGPLLSSPLMRWWPGVSAYQLQGRDTRHDKFGAFDREKVSKSTNSAQHKNCQQRADIVCKQCILSTSLSTCKLGFNVCANPTEHKSDGRAWQNMCTPVWPQWMKHENARTS